MDIGTRIKVNKDRLIARRLVDANMTAGGLELPATARKEKNEAEVLYVGNTSDEDYARFQPGDTIYFVACAPVRINGEDLIVVPFEQILFAIPPVTPAHQG